MLKDLVQLCCVKAFPVKQKLIFQLYSTSFHLSVNHWKKFGLSSRYFTVGCYLYALVDLIARCKKVIPSRSSGDTPLHKVCRTGRYVCYSWEKMMSAYCEL